MAGHSKWSKVKHFKGKIDSARAQVFSRCSKEITVSARTGGGDPNFNARLRNAISAAKAANMPADNIERAIKKGTGELEGIQYEEALYEGYGAGGIAFLVEVLTDNKNRAAADIRRIFSKHHGNLASPGSVAYLFNRRGSICLAKDSIPEEVLMELVLEAGAEDIKSETESYEVITSVDTFDAVQEAVRKHKLEISEARLTYLSQTLTSVSDSTIAHQVLELYETLDQSDDVQRVHANFDISDEFLASYASQ